MAWQYIQSVTKLFVFYITKKFWFPIEIFIDENFLQGCEIDQKFLYFLNFGRKKFHLGIFFTTDRTVKKNKSFII